MPRINQNHPNPLNPIMGITSILISPYKMNPHFTSSRLPCNDMKPNILPYHHNMYKNQ